MSKRRFYIKNVQIIEQIKKITQRQKPTGTKPKDTVEITPEEKAEISELESVLQTLDSSFKRVASIEDPVKREYKLFQEAKRMEIPAESYRRMFETYYLERLPSENQPPWVKPIKSIDQRLGNFVKWSENISLYGLATVISPKMTKKLLTSY